MQEKLLHFIWQYHLYRPDRLCTTQGELLQVVHPGTLNLDSGPDFSNARIRIGRMILAGNIELHIRTGDWYRHGHEKDAAYSNLILHVVYEHDTGPDLPGNIAVLPLKQHIPDFVIAQYTHLLQATATIPCGRQLPKVRTIIRESWLARLLVERWQEKLSSWEEELRQCNSDWSTFLYRRMAANFGFKVNAVPFQLLARSLPLQYLGKQHQLLQIEALLFGQAGLLNGKFMDPYPQALQEEYAYLRHKYRLTPVESYLWKFMRLRPANFPTVRLAQFAALVHRSLHLFLRIGEAGTLAELVALLDVTASAYWDHHYRFDDGHHSSRPKRLGEESVFNVIINTIAPVQFLYAHTQGNREKSEAALQLLEEIPPEEHQLSRRWDAHGWNAVSAAQSQALLQLYQRYCSRKRCLECAVGLSIIRSGPDK